MTELFIKYLKGHVGDIYVWGAQGETDITEKWIRRRETGEKNAKRAIALWEKRKAEGRSPIAAFDCSGLIVKFLLDNKLIKSDMSSRGLYSACEKLNDRSQLMPGDLLFRHNGKRITSRWRIYRLRPRNRGNGPGRRGGAQLPGFKRRWLLEQIRQAARTEGQRGNGRGIRMLQGGGLSLPAAYEGNTERRKQ